MAPSLTISKYIKSDEITPTERQLFNKDSKGFTIHFINQRQRLRTDAKETKQNI